jgi:hypothetical protein
MYPELAIPLLIVDVDNEDLSDLVSDVRAMPTIEFYKSGVLQHSIEGFKRGEVSRLLEEWLN